MEIEILSEADTRAKLIDPVLHSIGWSPFNKKKRPHTGSKCIFHV